MDKAAKIKNSGLDPRDTRDPYIEEVNIPVTVKHTAFQKSANEPIDQQDKDNRMWLGMNNQDFEKSPRKTPKSRSGFLKSSSNFFNKSKKGSHISGHQKSIIEDQSINPLDLISRQPTG